MQNEKLIRDLMESLSLSKENYEIDSLYESLEIKNLKNEFILTYKKDKKVLYKANLEKKVYMPLLYNEKSLDENALDNINNIINKNKSNIIAYIEKIDTEQIFLETLIKEKIKNNGLFKFALLKEKLLYNLRDLSHDFDIIEKNSQKGENPFNFNKGFLYNEDIEIDFKNDAEVNIKNINIDENIVDKIIDFLIKRERNAGLIDIPTTNKFLKTKDILFHNIKALIDTLSWTLITKLENNYIEYEKEFDDYIIKIKEIENNKIALIMNNKNRDVFYVNNEYNKLNIKLSHNEKLEDLFIDNFMYTNMDIYVIIEYMNIITKHLDSINYEDLKKELVKDI